MFITDKEQLEMLTKYSKKCNGDEYKGFCDGMDTILNHFNIEIKIIKENKTEDKKINENPDDVIKDTIKNKQHISPRDIFAAAALNGLMQRFGQKGYSDKGAIGEAYRIANMMMEKRNIE